MATTALDSPAASHHKPAVKQHLKLALYDDPHSEFSSKVKVALYAKGLEWTPLAVPCGGGTRSPEFLAVNPLGKIPALLVTDEQGRREAVVESEVIVEFLEDAFPGHPRLLPEEPLERSRARLIARLHDLYLEPALRRLYPQVAPSTRSEAVVQEAAAAFRARLAELDALLPPNRQLAVTHNQLTVADCGYPALLLYGELILPAVGQPPLQESYTPRLAAWRRALWAQPAVARVLSSLQPAAQEWLDGKLRQ
ncbi:hypothetical protein HYH03_001219 [Edaphochlamys debaryana]|uniref:Glutathione transferase n=1 Tax=Edaphochlamys debaryana TaxID=47281 RepID=A0A835YF76_9CHLO|nr:hypothetical protein HYH03_001219 [Edaphochlamys debaryana]|eukprot:KAG2501436.1 hypothetical protein HYH03_001219 [Edaphochlamys debaryana]